MALLDFLFAGSPPPNVSSTTVSTSGQPDWYQEYLRGLMGKANAVAGQEYTPYDFQRVADVQPAQQQGWDLASQNVGAATPYFQTGQTALNQGASPGLNNPVFQSYMDPITNAQTGVLNRIADLGARNLSEKLLPQVNDTFTGAGQFGSSRNAEFNARALRDTNEAILGQQANTLMQGINTGMQNYQTGMNRGVSAGTALGNMGQQAQQAGIRDAATMQDVGTQQRQIEQQSLDTAYQDFLDQRDWGKTQTRFMNEAIRGLQPQADKVATTNGPGSTFQPSVLSQLAGTAIAAGQLAKNFKKGGSVLKGMRRYG